MTEKTLLLKREVAEYMDALKATQAERRELLAWVQDGNSVYDNPWYMADEQWRPIDYISTVREINTYRRENALH